MKNVLVVGGSYFIGKVFVLRLLKNKDYSIYVMNRGNRPLRLQKINEYVCDRNDIEQIANRIPALNWDIVVDFCAYLPQEIETLINNLPGVIGQYIYISSCAVYEPTLNYPKYEDSPKLTHPLTGPVGDYGYNKWLCELETIKCCQMQSIPYTILRPSFVYGPFNYAPRESYFFELILQGKSITIPDNSLALFQFIYVRDIADLCIACLGNKETYNSAFNLSAGELISYKKLIKVLEEVCGKHIQTRECAIEKIYRDNIPLPFPLDQHELFSGDLIAGMLNYRYTPFAIGMKETFEFYKKYCVT